MRFVRGDELIETSGQAVKHLNLTHVQELRHHVHERDEQGVDLFVDKRKPDDVVLVEGVALGPLPLLVESHYGQCQLANAAQETNLVQFTPPRSTLRLVNRFCPGQKQDQEQGIYGHRELHWNWRCVLTDVQ